MTPLPRRTVLSAALAVAAFALLPLVPAHASGEAGDVYKSPWCGCCTAWIDHMREAGFDLRVTDLEDMASIKAPLGVTPGLESCHTAVIGGYVIEGHVPAREIARLLSERPTATGLAAPGMPMGSPGMETQGKSDAYDVILFAPGGNEVFASY